VHSSQDATDWLTGWLAGWLAKKTAMYAVVKASCCCQVCLWLYACCYKHTAVTNTVHKTQMVRAHPFIQPQTLRECNLINLNSMHVMQAQCATVNQTEALEQTPDAKHSQNGAYVVT
jgi:hypothetical protein